MQYSNLRYQLLQRKRWCYLHRLVKIVLLGSQLITAILYNDSFFQPVIAMQLVQVRYNVLIQVVNVPVMLDTRVPNVMLHVVVTLQVQVEQLVMLPPGNVLVTLDTQGQHVIHVLQTITERVMALVQVSEIIFLTF